MLKTLKFRGKDTDFFFGGCLHHNHNPKWPVPLWKQRGFNSVQEHDVHQIKKWNEVCNETSIVFLLGDSIFHDSSGENFKKLINQLRFKELYLLPGNHVSGWIQNYKRELQFQYIDSISHTGEIIFEVYPLIEYVNHDKNVIYVPNYLELDINGIQIILSHYAIRSWNKMARESWMLHSHEHLANLESDLGAENNGKIADVGYETLLKYNDGAPISVEKLRKFMNKKEYKPIGHH
jgi:calcineurin-like phosphoesterase family protein